MQVTLETTSGLERRMRISVPSETLESQVEAKIKQTASQVQLKGFRKGKVPLREVKRRFGAGIRQEVGSEIMQSSFADAVRQEDVVPAGSPQIEDVSIEAGKDLEFTAVFEVFPEVADLKFTDIKVERPVATINEADIEKMIETLRDQRSEFSAVDRASADGDQVNIDFEGFLGGEAFEGGKAEGSDLVLGSGSMIPGFEDGIKGMATGEEKEISVTFPEDYQSENLAGNETMFKIKVNTVSESARPELNEAFFENFGVTEGGMDAFMTEVKSNMEKELEAAIKTKVKNQVMDGLLEHNSVDLPSALIAQEIDRLRQEAVQQFGGAQQIDPSILPAEMFTAQAEKRVSLGLLVNAIVEQKTLKVDDEKVKEMIHSMASSYEEPEQVINHYYGNPQQLAQVENLVLEDQVIDTILEGAQVTDIEQSYDESVKPAEPAAPVADQEAVADAEETPSVETPKED